MSGAANLGSQLAQEGSEGEFSGSFFSWSNGINSSRRRSLTEGMTKGLATGECNLMQMLIQNRNFSRNAKRSNGS